MPRTRRYIFNTLTVVSLLLLLGTVGLWVESYWVGSELSWGSDDRIVGGFACQGRVMFVSGRTAGSSRDWDLGVNTGRSAEAPAEILLVFVDVELMGFGYGLDVPVSDMTADSLMLPHWFLTLIIAILPAVWIYKWRKRRKLGPNSCPGCGYDLTGNESGECPECGNSLVEQ